MIKKLLLLCLGVSIWCSVNAQYYSSGEPPFSQKWKQIKTTRYQLVFPVDFESEAQLFAAKLDYAIDSIGKSLKHSPSKMSIVLHGQPAYSNGLAAWAPKRIELYTTPNPETSGQKWLDHLLLHEVRHFVQMDKLNEGLTQVLSILFGQQGLGFILGASVPRWYMEGDAVAEETLLSQGGRGRMPSFEQGIRALVLEQGVPKYGRAFLGSYTMHIPNIYEVGYQVVMANRVLSSYNVFETQLDKLGSKFIFSGLPYSFRRNRQSYYTRAFDYLEPLWKRQDSLLSCTPYALMTKGSRFFTSYINIQSDGQHVYAEKKGIDNIPRFVRMDSDGTGEVLLAERGYGSNSRLSAGGGKLVWEEGAPDLRYDLKSYSEVQVFDVFTEKLRVLKKKTRWFAPAIDERGEQVILVEVDLQGKASLLLIDVDGGEVLRKLPNTDEVYYQYPFWIDSCHVGVIEQGDVGQVLVEINLRDGVRRELLPVTNDYISHPVAHGGYIYFSGSWSGLENIYALRCSDGRISRVTSARFGAAYPAVHGGELWYSDYSSAGARLVKTDLNPSEWEDLNKVNSMGLNLHDSVRSLENIESLEFSNIASKNYPVKSYSRFNLLNFHSWSPGFAFSSEGIFPGVSVFSQNLLGTSFLTLGYDGRREKRHERWFMNYSYRGFWPIINIGLKYGKRDINFVEYGTVETRPVQFFGDDVSRVITLQGNVTLPLNFSSGSRQRGLVGSVNYDMEWNEDFTYYLGPYEPHLSTIRWQELSGDLEDYAELRGSIYYYNHRQRSHRQLQTPWGYDMKFSYARELGKEYAAALWGIDGNIWLPGLLPTHGVRLGLAYEHRDNRAYTVGIMMQSYVQLDPVVTLPRGFSSLFGESYSLCSFNYSLPLFYPEWSLGSVLYLKRLQGLGFYDWASLRTYGWGGDFVRVNPISYGGELRGEFYFLNYEFPLVLGLRLGKNDWTKKWFAESIVSLSF